MYETLNHYIDGKWVEPTGTKSQDVMNPSKDAVLGKLGHASKADLDKAIAAADKGFQAWRKTSAHDRSKILRKVADALEAGMVTINHHGLALPETPFGGIKDSGFGHEGGAEGLTVYMQAKFVSQFG